MVVGLVAIGISGGGVSGDVGGGKSGTNQPTGALKCPDDLGRSLPPERIANVESGAHDQIIVGPASSKTQPFGLRFTDGGAAVGAMTATFFPASGVFKIQSIVDAQCEPGLGGDADIRLRFTKFVP